MFFIFPTTWYWSTLEQNIRSLIGRTYGERVLHNNLLLCGGGNEVPSHRLAVPLLVDAPGMTQPTSYNVGSHRDSSSLRDGNILVCCQCSVNCSFTLTLVYLICSTYCSVCVKMNIIELFRHILETEFCDSLRND